MAKVTLNPKRMLGFRLLDDIAASDDRGTLSAKYGKVDREPRIGDQVAISAKFGKRGKPQ